MGTGRHDHYRGAVGKTAETAFALTKRGFRHFSLAQGTGEPKSNPNGCEKRRAGPGQPSPTLLGFHAFVGGPGVVQPKIRVLGDEYGERSIAEHFFDFALDAIRGGVG